MHRPGDADAPAAAAAVRAGHPQFSCQHRGNRFISSALTLPMTARSGTDIRHYIDTRRLDLVRFAKGQSKDQVAKEYLAGHHGGECILDRPGKFGGTFLPI